MTAALLERIMARVEKQPNGCWQWTGPLRPDGYAQIEHKRRKVLAHRAVFEALREPIPYKLVLDHLCRNRGCVNPDHLESVTQALNTRRGLSSVATKAMHDRLWEGRTNCPQGHVLADVGVVERFRGGYRTRECGGCIRDRKARAYQRDMADPEKAARRRELNRQAVARRRARLKESA